MNIYVQIILIATSVFALYRGDTISDVDNVLKDKVAPGRYNTRIRGVEDQTKRVYVNATFMLAAIENFSEVHEYLETMGVLFLSWIDERLKWDPVDYNGTSVMHVYQTDVWRPEVTLSNPSTAVKLLGDDRIMLEVRSTGVVSWRAADVFKSACPVNVESYPWDKQECNINFVVWGYTAQEVQLKGVSNPIVGDSDGSINLDHYRKNGQWRITSTDSRDMDTGIVSQITFTVRLERRAVFDVIIVIIPTVTLSLLSLIVFFLPVQSGERMSYSITVLLSTAVLLTFLGNHLPKNADSMAAICYFISAVLVMSTVICACSVFSLVLYHRTGGNGSPPYWMIRIVQACRRTQTRVGDDVVAIGKADVDDVTKEYQYNTNGAEAGTTTLGHVTIVWTDVSKCFDMFCFMSMVLVIIILSCMYFSNAI